MVNHKEVRQSLRKQLLTVSGLPSDRAWENRAFTTPNPPGPYIRETYLPGIEHHVASNQVMALGFMQWDVFIAARDGTEEVEAMADSIKDAFKPGTSLDSLVQIVRTERDSGKQEAEWYWVPVRVSWRVFATL